MQALNEAGVPAKHVVRFVEYFPRSLKVPPNRFKELIEEVKRSGFDPSRLHFVIALQNKAALSSSTRARKESVYWNWGWSDDDIFTAFRLHPFCISVSEFEGSGLVHPPSLVRFVSCHEKEADKLLNLYKDKLTLSGDQSVLTIDLDVLIAHRLKVSIESCVAAVVRCIVQNFGLQYRLGMRQHVVVSILMERENYFSEDVL
ncbi:hypothetical protein RJT34_14734 [Clitoria ternatea]|uniref:Uncharacterized protein n=1 Tax=Clitoria ternatea TaxID=43366 RepID=A0AAN9JTT7_CLITE